jgi:hypothetical protein
MNAHRRSTLSRIKKLVFLMEEPIVDVRPELLKDESSSTAPITLVLP